MSHWYVLGFVKLNEIGQHVELVTLWSPSLSVHERVDTRDRGLVGINCFLIRSRHRF